MTGGATEGRGNRALPRPEPALLLIVASVEALLLGLIRRHDILHLVEAAQGVVIGKPHWRVDESRVLGPFAIAALAWLVRIGYARAFVLVMALLVYLKDFALYAALRRFCGPAASCGLAAGAAALFLLAQDSWLYPWDLIDVAISAGVIWLAARPRPVWVPIALFAIALFNRESSAFIGLWLIIDAAVVEGRTGPLPFRVSLARTGRVVAGLALVALTLIVDEMLRRALFRSATMASIAAGRHGLEFGGTVQVKLAYNLHALLTSFTPSGTLLVLASDLFYLAMLLLFLSRLWVDDLRLKKLALLATAEALALPVFGLVAELRTFSGLIPFMVLLAFPHLAGAGAESRQAGMPLLNPRASRSGV